MMHFPVSQIFPPLFRIFHSLGKRSQLFPLKYVLSTKLSDDIFLVIDSEFIIPPIFAKMLDFPLSLKIYYFPLYFRKFPPDIIEFTCFCILYVFFVSHLL